jgi:hypothetical protein
VMSAVGIGVHGRGDLLTLSQLDLSVGAMLRVSAPSAASSIASLVRCWWVPSARPTAC